jgi:ATP-binding cassette subfamily B protein
VSIPIREYWRLLSRYLVSQRTAALWMTLLLLGSTAMGLAIPQVGRRFVDAALAGASQPLLARLAVAALVVGLGGQGLNVLASYWAKRVAWTATNALRLDLVAHIVRLDLSFHKVRTPGELIERIDGDVSALLGFFSSFVVEVLGSLLLLVGILVTILIEDVVLGVPFVVFALLSIVFLSWIQRFAPPHWRADREQRARYYGFVGETLTATEDIRSCGAVEYALRRLLQYLRRWRPVQLRASLWGSVWMVGIAVFAVAEVLVRGIGGPMVLNGTMSLGTLYMLAHYLELLVWGPISNLQYQVEDLQHAQASIVRVQELLDTTSALTEGTVELSSGAPTVSYERVSFAYEADDLEAVPSDDFVLHDLSFHLRAGRVLGLLGRTGSGKTTVACLLFRFYDPQQGTIRLGDVDLRECKLDALRARIGLVTQDVQLLNASLRDNLTFFDLQVSDDDLLATLRALGLAQWVERLPAGLDTPISGEMLSAGEAQLVALARVFLKDPDLVILDEASSRLDPATETLLGQALDALLEGRSAVIIAHRLATVERADDILILERGRSMEHGARVDLAADSQSTFARLLRTGIEEVLA